MKSNIIKYLFIAFAIFIIGFAIYKISSKDTEEIAQNETDSGQSTQDVESTLRIGIPEFDNINPLITDNKDIISLSTILYEPLIGITSDYKIE